MKTQFLALTILFIAAMFFSPESAAAAHLRVLTYNIHHGEGRDRRFDLERLANVIKSAKPDVVAIQEVDRHTRRAQEADQAAILGQLTGLKSVFGKAMHFSGGEYGEALLSRFPIDQVEVHPLPFRFGQEPRAALQARITPDNGLPAFILIGTHLCHQSETTRADQTEQINKLVAEEGGSPVILAGDLNARTGSVPMNILLQKRWIDASAPKSRIDYVLLRQNDPWKVIEVTVIDERVASDHRPVLVVLEWNG